MNSSLKSLIKKRQEAFARNNQALYKQLPNKVNRSGKNYRKLYYEAKVKDLKNQKPKDWWREVKHLCGNQQKSTRNIFANLEQDTQDLDSLSNLINDCFLEPMRDCEPLPDNIFTMTENGSLILLSEEDVFILLNNVKPGKSSGPDCPIGSYRTLEASSKACFYNYKVRIIKKIKCLLVGTWLIFVQYRKVSK